MAVKVWYDNRADDLTKEGMLKGIEQAAVFFLFLSTDGKKVPVSLIFIIFTWTQTPVLNRPYCQMEIRHALELKKPVVLLHGEMSESTRCVRPHDCAFSSDRRLPPALLFSSSFSFLVCVRL